MSGSCVRKIYQINQNLIYNKKLGVEEIYRQLIRIAEWLQIKIVFKTRKYLLLNFTSFLEYKFKQFACRSIIHTFQKEILHNTGFKIRINNIEKNLCTFRINKTFIYIYIYIYITINAKIKNWYIKYRSCSVYLLKLKKN